MNAVVTPEIQEVFNALHYRPAVSIILPFEPKINAHSELIHSLKIAADKVEQELTRDYPAHLTTLVMQKLRQVIKNLNLNGHKKSIAIYVSPVFEKVLYLDIPVEERVMVDDSFEIRDLVYSKKQLHRYLVLLLSNKESRMYLGNSNTFVKIVSNSSESVYGNAKDESERVANFSDPSERKEVLMNKFLHHVDNSLEIILNAYRLPLFVMGTKRITGHFNKITKHGHSVVEYIHGNYEDFTSEQLKDKLKPHITNWKNVMQKDILNHLEEAIGKEKLSVGMKDVWREAMNNKGRLLVVEKNYLYPAMKGDRYDVIYKAVEPYNELSYLKDAVDQVIEKVLESGGDVEFVDQDVLKDYDHIALIQYY